MVMADGMSMAQVDTELDKVLRPLTGYPLYDDNVFRITGLLVDATPVQVRRRREEAAMEARFGSAPRAVGGDAWHQPETDGEILRNAFEALRNPVLRLTHEMLWLRRDLDDGHPQNAAVRAHGEALQREATGEPAADDAWRTGLAHWAAAFDLEETWERAKRRVREIDDPRLTLATVRRLRDRLPELVVGVNVALAAQAARNGDVDDAERHMALLDTSPFPAAVVRHVTRDTVRPAETKIEAACEQAQRLCGPGKGLAPLHRMLADIDSPLLVVESLLGDDDPLCEALHDRVAGTLNGCAVDHFNETRDAEAALPMLRRAADLARDEHIADLVGRNIEVVRSEVEYGEELVDRYRPTVVDQPVYAYELPPAIEQMCRAGGVNAAAARMRAWRRWTKDPVERARLSRILDDPRGLVSPVQSAPSTGCFFFLGGHLYGGKDVQLTSGIPTSGELPDYTCVKTYFVTFLWFPLIPVTAHITGWDRRRGAVYGGRVPLGALARWYRVLVLLALPLTVFSLVYGLSVAAIAIVAGVLVAFTAVCLVLRQIYLWSWVRRYV